MDFQPLASMLLDGSEVLAHALNASSMSLIISTACVMQAGSVQMRVGQG